MRPALVIACIFLSLAMAVAWAVHRRTGNSGWIDAIWTFAVGLAAVLALSMMTADGARRVLLSLLVSVWSARLGLHIVKRTLRSSDDPRYADLIAQWGPSAPLRLFVFLQVQALAGMVLVVATALAAASAAPALSAGTALFSLLALLSVAGEGVADTQLAQCKRNRPPDGVCRTGLWARSRHPNYFFEWLYWLSVALIALVPATSAIAWLALAAPALMYVILRHGSGVPHLEAHMQRTRPAAFADYAKTVPVFFPRLWR